MATQTIVSAITSGAALTPMRKRHARPSHSPIKSQEPMPTGSALRHSKSMELEVLRGSKPLSPEKTYYLPTAALEFKEFSFFGPEGSVDHARIPNKNEYLHALLHYLAEHYNATSFLVCGPCLVIECEEEPPPEHERPFSVAGLVAIWRRSGLPQFIPLLGSDGQGEAIAIDPRVAAQIHQRRYIPQEAVIYLAEKIFPDCIAISMLWRTLVIELPTTSEEDFFKRLKYLPSRLKEVNASLAFHNGPISGTVASLRAIQPSPSYIHGAQDTTDYIKLHQKFYPGSMIGSLNPDGSLQQLATAGVKVSRGHEERLICPFHCWESLDKDNPGLLGQTSKEAQKVFAVQQGNNPGTKVAFLRERLGCSDVALAQLHPSTNFENVFMEMDYKPRKLEHGYEQLNGDEYVIDGFCTGKQRVKGFGHRFSIGRTKNTKSDNIFIKMEQGVYMTNEPLMTKPPFIRQGVCGAVLLKCKDSKRDTDDEDTVMQRGQIGGMMHYVNVATQNERFLVSYLCFATSFTPLINAGWEIAKEPSSAGHSDLDEGLLSDMQDISISTTDAHVVMSEVAREDDGKDNEELLLQTGRLSVNENEPKGPSERVRGHRSGFQRGHDTLGGIHASGRPGPQRGEHRQESSRGTLASEIQSARGDERDQIRTRATRARGSRGGRSNERRSRPPWRF